MKDKDTIMKKKDWQCDFHQTNNVIVKKMDKNEICKFFFNLLFTLLKTKSS